MPLEWTRRAKHERLKDSPAISLPPHQTLQPQPRGLSLSHRQALLSNPHFPLTSSAEAVSGPWEWLLKKKKNPQSWVARTTDPGVRFLHFFSKRPEAAGVLSLTINQSHPPIVQSTCLLPFLGLFSRILGKDQTLAVTEKFHLSIPFLPLKSLVGKRKSKCAGVNRSAVEGCAYGKARHGHPHFAVQASETRRGKPACQGHRARQAEGRPRRLPAPPLGGGGNGERRAGGACPTPGGQPRASRTLRGCSPRPR